VAQERRDYQLTIRIPKRIRAAIGAKAEGEQRSVADIVNHILAEIFPVSPTKDKGRRR
jgi:hypothetical protein